MMLGGAGNENRQSLQPTDHYCTGEPTASLADVTRRGCCLSPKPSADASLLPRRLVGSSNLSMRLMFTRA